MTTRKAKLFSGNPTSHMFSVLPMTPETMFKPIQLPRPMLEGSQPMQDQEYKEYWMLSVLRNNAEDCRDKTLPWCRCHTGETAPHSPVQAAVTTGVSASVCVCIWVLDVNKRRLKHF